MDNFDLSGYLAKNPLLLEVDLPKNKWVTVPEENLEDYKDDIFKLIKTAYSSIGGHSNYKSAKDITGSEKDKEYTVIDINNDSEIDAVNVANPKAPAGVKLTATGHNGTPPAKREMLKHTVELLKKPGYYIEVSGRIKDILLNAGVPVVTDKNTLEKVLKGKGIVINDDGTYNRKIAGTEYTKLLMGSPL